MNNPYRPPSSEVTDISPEKKSKLWWKILFWVILVLQLLSIAFMFIEPDELFYMAGDVIVYSVILIGLFGFAYNKRIINRKFWVYVIPAGLLWDSFGIYEMITTEGTQITNPTQLYFFFGTFLVIVLPMLFLQYLALYNYSLKSEEIWR